MFGHLLCQFVIGLTTGVHRLRAWQRTRSAVAVRDNLLIDTHASMWASRWPPSRVAASRSSLKTVPNFASSSSGHARVAGPPTAGPAG